MTKKRKRFVKEEQASYSNLPQFTSTFDEVKNAIEQNAFDRGGLLIRVIVSLEIDELLALVDKISTLYDREDFSELASDIGIDIEALKKLEDSNPPTQYAYYFCLPDILISHPELVFYYRNIAMLSRKVMRGVGLDVERFELTGATPSVEDAQSLATYFNEITSRLVLAGGVSPYRHIIMMAANLGDSLGGTSRNEVGRMAMVRVINPLIRHLHSRGRLSEVFYSLKGQVVIKEEEVEEEIEEVNVGQQKLVITTQTDIEARLKHFEAYRVVYHELGTKNGSRLLLNRQLKWYDSIGGVYKVGPDLHSQVGDIDMLWAGELKGGADPAGSDEHWKTATKALDRIIDAAEATNRPKPMLSFIATILVGRVAREAQSWIAQGKLKSVYNLTRMYEKTEEMEKFLEEMSLFLGYGTDND